MITALETTYDGITFRSRLEAKWAVVFNELGLRWNYEPDGYLVAGGGYLPDFEICVSGSWVWFEVKHEDYEESDVEKRQWAELAERSGRPLYIAFGLPNENGEWPHELSPTWQYRSFRNMIIHYGLTVVWGWNRVFDSPNGDSGYQFTACDTCSQIGLTYEGRSDRVPCPCDAMDRRTRWNLRNLEVKEAYSVARRTRFAS